MKDDQLEIRLKRTAKVAAAPRSLVEDVMVQIGSAQPDASPRSRWNHPYLAAGIAALSGIAAVIVFVLFISSATQLTMADVQKAFEEQKWVHTHYDAGQLKDRWVNLQTGEFWFVEYDGGAGYLNEETNTRLTYWNQASVIDQYAPSVYSKGDSPPQWNPHTAWEEFVAPYAQAAATTQPTDPALVSTVAVKDVLNGVPTIRFDEYSTDMVGKRFILMQVWADPKTHLPLQCKTRLQLGEREQWGKQWSTGTYDFPATGPADLYALGVPRDLPIHKQVTTAPAAVQPVLDGISHAYDNFLKNYRAVIWELQPGSAFPLGSLDVVWHQAEKVRDNRYLTDDTNHLQSVPLTSAALLTWAGQHPAEQMQMMDSEREYSWWSPALAKGAKPQLQIMRHHRFPLVATDEWPETIQWPTRDWGVDFELLTADAETPKGCTGIRKTDGISYRRDYFIDRADDYICIKHIEWTKRGSKWAKTQEITLSDLHRIDGRVVAGTQRKHNFADPVKGYGDDTTITTIDLVPMGPKDYPAGTFDAETLKKGATVEGY